MGGGVPGRPVLEGGGPSTSFPVAPHSTFERARHKWPPLIGGGPSRFLCGGGHIRASGSWTPLFIGLPNHGKWGRTPAYSWVIGMAMCRDKEISTWATLWDENLSVFGPLVLH